MIVIRPAQLSVLAEPAVANHVAGALKWLRAAFPDAFERRGTDAVRALLLAAHGQARTYGLSRGGDVTALAALMLVFGEDVLLRPEHAWTLDILGSDRIAGDAKLAMILERLLADVEPAV